MFGGEEGKTEGKVAEGADAGSTEMHSSGKVILEPLAKEAEGDPKPELKSQKSSPRVTVDKLAKKAAMLFAGHVRVPLSDDPQLSSLSSRPHVSSLTSLSFPSITSASSIALEILHTSFENPNDLRRNATYSSTCTCMCAYVVCGCMRVMTAGGKVDPVLRLRLSTHHVQLRLQLHRLG